MKYRIGYLMRMSTLLMVSMVILLESTWAQTKGDIGVQVDVPFPPSPVEGNGKINLVYEIHLTNFTNKDVTLKDAAVYSTNKNVPLLTLKDEELANYLFRPGSASDTSDIRIIKNGKRSVLYLWIGLDKANEIPRILFHRLTFSLVTSTGQSVDMNINQFPVPVKSNEPVLILPPVQSGTWLLWDGPSNDNPDAHRRSLHTLDGRTTIAERFAIDLMKIGEDGTLWKGDPSKNESYYGYGEELLAVSDAVVAGTNDGLEDNTPPEIPKGMKRATASGNYVILDLGQGRYAFYGHIKPGSIMVKTGERVKTGQVIGLIGNSGISDAPHLHFHVIDSNDPFAAEGISYQLETFEILRPMTTSEIETTLFNDMSWKDLPAKPVTERKREMPMGSGVISIP